MSLLECLIRAKPHAATVIAIALASYLIFQHSSYNSVSRQCQSGEFYLKGMDSCHPLLSCKDFNSIRLGELVGVGAVKAVYHAKWKGYDVALSILNNQNYENDFLTGAENVRMLQLNPYTIQAVGFCLREKMYLTEFHKNGDASKFINILNKYPKEKNNLLLRINFCLDYAQILASLHNPDRSWIHEPNVMPRVMCDSNDLKKLLSQFLVTDELSLILNDLDAIPLVKEGGIKCGHQELKGDFVAPEQLWKLPGNFVDEEMPGYDEKIDIWRVPSVCNYFLRDVPGGNDIAIQLLSTHKRCMSDNPILRPTADELVSHYLAIKRNIETNMREEIN